MHINSANLYILKQKEIWQRKYFVILIFRILNFFIASISIKTNNSIVFYKHVHFSATFLPTKIKILFLWIFFCEPTAALPTFYLSLSEYKKIHKHYVKFFIQLEMLRDIRSPSFWEESTKIDENKDIFIFYFFSAKTGEKSFQPQSLAKLHNKIMELR